MVTTPMAIPSGRPAPPEKATPPRMAAVSTSSSKRTPIVGVMLLSRPAISTATRPMSTPLTA